VEGSQRMVLSSLANTLRGEELRKRGGDWILSKLDKDGKHVKQYTRARDITPLDTGRRHYLTEVHFFSVRGLHTYGRIHSSSSGGLVVPG